MMTVHEVSKLSGVSIRTLQYYDKIGLLRPTEYTESGYRLYDDTALEQLQQILLFRELEFPLKEIKEIISRPDFDKNKALEQQISLLTLKKERLENLICFARGIQFTGGKAMDFSAFDTQKIDDYARRAKEQWGATAEYKEFQQKSQGRSKEEEQDITKGLLRIFADFGKLKEEGAESAAAQGMVKKLQDYITAHYYVCSKEVLAGLGQMYAAGGEFTENIDSVGGKGTAEFAGEAIRVYACEQ